MLNVWNSEERGLTSDAVRKDQQRCLGAEEIGGARMELIASPGGPSQPSAGMPLANFFESIVLCLWLVARLVVTVVGVRGDLSWSQKQGLVWGLIECFGRLISLDE